MKTDIAKFIDHTLLKADAKASDSSFKIARNVV